MKKGARESGQTTETERQTLQCHFISNTHWDREWRFSAQRTRYMLDYLMEMLFDIFEKEPRFRHFHLDSQTLPIQDYLEVRPGKADLVRKYVSEGRLAIGPWFCLPDEYCVGGESLIRNLLAGHAIARKLGKVSKTGYAPFGWGQISQMPQIYAGFGIDMTSFYRGINAEMAPRSEFLWEGPDGTRMLASRLGMRPRYNVWYIVQRPAYWRQADENNRTMSWRQGNSPFRFVDASRCEQDYQYAHPVFAYAAEEVPQRARQAVAEQDEDWSTPHRFWSAGHDSSCPDIREPDMIADCDRALEGTARVFHSTVAAWEEGVKATARRDELPVLRGEMHEPSTRKGMSALLGWITSSRMHIKQDNFRTEGALTCYAEPLAVFASLLGAPYPRHFIEAAYTYLLQNHGHDSIGACGRDIVSEDVLYRSRQSREISGCVMERACMDIAGDIDLSAWSADQMAIVVFNPTPFLRSEVMELVVEIPAEWNCESFDLLDDEGEKVAVQFCSEGRPCNSVVQSPNDVANTFPSTRYSVRADLREVPGMGYRTFRTAPSTKAASTGPETMRRSERSMENEFLKVSINRNGTLDVTEKGSGKTYKGLGYFRDTGETGNPWQHVPPESDTLYTTLKEDAEVTLIHDGALETAYQVRIDWALPQGRSSDEKTRSGCLKPYPIRSTITLRKGQRWVEVATELDNTAEDHYLQVSFPTGIAAARVMAQSQFDVVSRPVARRAYPQGEEAPMSEQPMSSFIDLSEGGSGIALLNEGLKAYEADGDAERTLSLTLLRCYPLRICVTSEMLDYSQLDKGSQCLGRHSFRYAIMPHAGDWEAGLVWQASERFTLELSAAQIGPSRHGKSPLSKSFLELAKEGLHVSAVKQSEDGSGWIVRVFNPSDSAMRNSLRLNGGHAGPGRSQSPVERLKAELALPTGCGAAWSAVRLVSLEEAPQRTLSVDDRGWVAFEIPGKKILTFEFIP